MIKAVNKTFISSTRSFIPGILLLCLLLAGCSNDPKDIDLLTGKHNLNEDIAYNVEIIYSERGNTKVRIFGTEFVRNDFAKPSYTEIRKGLKIEFFDDSLQVESTLTGKYARFYDENKSVLIRDSIIVRTRKQEEIRTEELVWNQKVKKIYTEMPVEIKTPTQTMYGDALEAEEDFSVYEIKNLRGSLKVDKGQIPE